MASLALFVSGRDQRVCARGLNVQLVFRERSGPAVRHERAPGRPLPACHVRSRGPAKASKGARARFLHGCSARTISNAMHRSALPDRIRIHGFDQSKLSRHADCLKPEGDARGWRLGP
jgi:hypothetical protein